MVDRNPTARSITGLNPVQKIVCDKLDLVQEISINGSVPTSTHFWGYDPSIEKTKYMTPTDTTMSYTGGTGITINGTTVNFTGGDLGTIDVIIRGILSTTSSLVATGNVFMSNLPTSDPQQVGQLWND